MTTVTVTTTWRAVQQVEVPEDVAQRDMITWPEEYLDQVNALGAELIDWEVT